jgi:hypothetical protein
LINHQAGGSGQGLIVWTQSDDGLEATLTDRGDRVVQQAVEPRSDAGVAHPAEHDRGSEPTCVGLLGKAVPCEREDLRVPQVSERLGDIFDDRQVGVQERRPKGGRSAGAREFYEARDRRPCDFGAGVPNP